MWYWLEIVRYNWIYNSKLVLLWDSIFEFVFKKKLLEFIKEMKD